MRGAVKHNAMIVFVCQSIENTGIDTDVNDEKRDEKNPGERHDYFSTNRRGKNPFPRHIVQLLLGEPDKGKSQNGKRWFAVYINERFYKFVLVKKMCWFFRPQIA